MTAELRLRFVPLKQVGASVVLIPERRLALVEVGMSYELALAAIAKVATSQGLSTGVPDVPAEVFAARAREQALEALALCALRPTGDRAAR